MKYQIQELEDEEIFKILEKKCVHCGDFMLSEEPCCDMELARRVIEE
jgi:hypothetical protein